MDGDDGCTGGESVRGVVLAGGASSRFQDGDKALARLGERSLLAHVVGTLRRATGREPLVVVRERADAAALREHLAAACDAAPAFATDRADVHGPLAGVLGACDATDAAELFVAACDMPRLDAAAVAWLLDEQPGADAVVPTRDGFLEPLHARYRRDAVLAAGERLPASAGVRALVDELEDVATVAAADCPAPLGRSLTNVNTVADLASIAGDGGTGGEKPGESGNDA